MNGYIDSSVVLRVVLNEPRALESWPEVSRPFASELITTECLRTVDRARLRLSLEESEVARLRSEILELLDRFTLVRLDDVILARASEPFPTLVGTLDAIHLASASYLRRDVEDLAFATHDGELALAATALGFELLA